MNMLHTKITTNSVPKDILKEIPDIIVQ